MTGQLRERLDDVRATISFQNDEFLSNETQSALQQFTNANVSTINITGTHPFFCFSILLLCLLLSSFLSFSSHSLPPPNPLPPPIPLNLLFYCSVSPFLSILPHPIPVSFLLVLVAMSTDSLSLHLLSSFPTADGSTTGAV